MADMIDKQEVDIVGSLFGLNPEAFQAAKESTAYTRGVESGRNPLGGILGNVGMFAERGAAGLRSAFGQQTPEEAVISLRQQAQQLNDNTPEGLIKVAQFLNENGDAAGARQAVMLAQGQQQRMATLGKTGAETVKALREKDPEIIRLQNTRDALESQFGPQDRRVIELTKIIEGKAKVGQTTISVDAKGETKFIEELGKLDAKEVDNARTQRSNAISALNSLDKLSSLNNQELISGTFATSRVGAANFLNTLGLASPADVARISSSQQYDKVVKDIILQTLGGKLGAGFSNEDRKFIESLVPQLETSSDARRKLIDFMQNKFTNVADEANRLETYARKNKGLSGYEPKIPLLKVSPTTAQYSKEELEAELRKRIEPK